MKITNNTIKRYLELNQELKRIEKEQNQLRQELLALGNTTIGNYTLKVTESEREYLKSLKQLVDKFGRNKLRGMIATTTIKRLTIK